MMPEGYGPHAFEWGHAGNAPTRITIKMIINRVLVSTLASVFFRGVEKFQRLPNA